MDPFKLFDESLLAIIVEYLLSEDVIRLQLVSRRWHEMLSSNFISKVAFLHHFSWSGDAFRYYKLFESPSKQNNMDLGASPPKSPDFDFTAAFRKALHRRISLRNAEPRRIRYLTDPQVWAVADSDEPGYLACSIPRGSDSPWLRIVHPDDTEIEVPIILPDLPNKIELLSALSGWSTPQMKTQTEVCKLIVQGLKIMSKVVVVYSHGTITVGWGYALRLTSVFQAFSTETGIMLWERCFPFHRCNSNLHTINPIAGSHFDLIKDRGLARLVCIHRHGELDRDGGVSVNWIDLQTGAEVNRAPLELGTVDEEGYGQFSPYDPLQRDIKMSKNGRYLVTVVLDKPPPFPSSIEYDKDSIPIGAAPQGVHQNRNYIANSRDHREQFFATYLTTIKDRIYRVYIHNLKTGKLIHHHELQRPCEPNLGTIKAEFSPKIHFSAAKDLISLVEETYMYSLNSLHHRKSYRYKRDREFVDSYGWTIDLQPKPSPIGCIRRTRYTSYLKDSEYERITSDAGRQTGSYIPIPAPYRTEKFFPGENISIISSSMLEGHYFDVCSYSMGDYEKSQGEMYEAMATTESRKRVIGPSTLKSGNSDDASWRIYEFTQDLDHCSGEWNYSSLMNERYFGICCDNDNRKLMILDFGG